MGVKNVLGKKRELDFVGSLPQLSLAALMYLSLVHVW